jgi:hypothetical protein
MTLKDKLHSTKISRGENVTSYLTNVQQIKDDLATVGDIIPESELVYIALNSFGKQWDVFVKCVVGRETLPTWESLWDDFIWEGSQRGDQKKKYDDEENLALASKLKERTRKVLLPNRMVRS